MGAVPNLNPILREGRKGASKITEPHTETSVKVIHALVEVPPPLSLIHMTPMGVSTTKSP